MALSWEELREDTCLRNVAIQEVEDQLMVLENMKKTDISVTCYQHTYDNIEGFMLDIKKLHSSFRTKAFENNLLLDKEYKKDAKALVQWQMTQWNRLDKLRPSKMPVLSPGKSKDLSMGAQGNIMHDALHSLSLTLEKSNEERDTNKNLTRPSFKGGTDSYLKFETYVKDFKTWTRNI